MEKKAEKQPNKLKQYINNLKATQRGKAILKLIRWFIFFMVILIICLIASMLGSNNINDNSKGENNNETNINDEVKKDEPEKIETGILSASEATNLFSFLKNADYNYKFEITVGDDKYIYNGTKEKDILTGYKENKEKTIKYYVDNTGEYEQTTSDKILITNLYENLKLEYVKMDDMINFFSSLEYSYERIGSKLYLKMASEVEIINIVFDEQDLESILITNTGQYDTAYTYDLNFEVKR